MKTDTQGTSVLDKRQMPRRTSSEHLQQRVTWHHRPPFESVGSSNNRQRMRASSGSGIARLPPELYESIENKFTRLSNEWKRDTGHMSTGSRIAVHPSYLSIVAMGESAIPLILKDIKSEPNHWFSALSAIAGEGPEIPAQYRGDMKRISEAWLEWGKSKHYIQ